MKTLRIAMAGVGIMLGMLMFQPQAQAESALLRLPFGIELGKKIPEKIAGRCTTVNRNGHVFRYKCMGKFWIHVKGKKMVNLRFLYLDKDTSHSLPSRWKKLGLYMRTDTKDGVSLSKALDIVKKQGAVHIEVNDKADYVRTIKFDLQDKYHFSMHFDVEGGRDAGLSDFWVDQNTLIEDY